MSEEEIIKEFIEDYNASYPEEEEWVVIYPNQVQAIQGLLDLYNKEKETNASLQKEIKLMKSININDNYISKDKIREKIKELEWVEEVYKCQCDSCRDIRDEGRYMAYKELLEE